MRISDDARRIEIIKKYRVTPELLVILQADKTIKEVHKRVNKHKAVKVSREDTRQAILDIVEHLPNL